MELHARTQATRSYALLTYDQALSHAQACANYSPNSEVYLTTRVYDIVF